MTQKKTFPGQTNWKNQGISRNDQTTGRWTPLSQTPNSFISSCRAHVVIHWAPKDLCSSTTPVLPDELHIAFLNGHLSTYLQDPSAEKLWSWLLQYCTISVTTQASFSKFYTMTSQNLHTSYLTQIHCLASVAIWNCAAWLNYPSN